MNLSHILLLLKGKEGGKYRSRKRVVNKKTGKLKYVYDYGKKKGKIVRIEEQPADKKNVHIGNKLNNKISQKIYNEYSNELHDLAKFNASLTKGYRTTLTDDDIKGYDYKNKKIQELVNKAISHKFPVYYDAGVIYFIVGQKQISFHTKGENFGLPNSSIEWDGVTNAHTYTEKEYAILKELRHTILEKRKENRKQKESELVEFGETKLLELQKKLKRTKLESSRTPIISKIEKLEKAVNAAWGKYGLYDILRKEMWVNFDPEINSLCNKLTRIYRDDYIVNYML